MSFQPAEDVQDHSVAGSLSEVDGAPPAVVAEAPAVGAPSVIAVVTGRRIADTCEVVRSEDLEHCKDGELRSPCRCRPTTCARIAILG